MHIILTKGLSHLFVRQGLVIVIDMTAHNKKEKLNLAMKTRYEKPQS